MASHGTERNGAAARQPVLSAACGARATAGGAGSTAGGSYAEKHTTQLNEETSRDVMYIKRRHGKPATSKKGAGAPSAAPAARSSRRRAANFNPRGAGQRRGS